MGVTMNANLNCKLPAATVVAFCAALILAPVAIAKDAEGKVLDAKAAKSLVSDRTWQTSVIGGPGYYYWSWKPDGIGMSSTERKDRQVSRYGNLEAKRQSPLL
jgi:hypothetical protein